jgi:hypothetical protein
MALAASAAGAITSATSTTDASGETAADAKDEAVWVQAAEAGTFKGYSGGGKPVKLDKKLFDQVVKNFHAHPSFSKGADGVGDADVIPVDFHHANEQPAALIAAKGAPAQGWVQDVETRDGDDGNLQLWARVRWLEQAKQYVRDGAYKWLSIAIWPDTLHPVSGENIGWYMSSIALTNDPFIQGMEPIAAKRMLARLSRGGAPERGPASFAYYVDPYNMPTTAEELLCELKRLFGMNELASGAEVVGELAKLRAYAKDPAGAPMGVDVDELLGAVRRLMNLPTLATADEVFAEVDKLLGAAASEGSDGNETNLDRRHEMSLILTLAARLGVSNDVITASRTNDKDPKASARVEFETERALETKLLESEAAKGDIKKLLDATGASSVDVAVAKIVALKKSDEDLARLGPEIESLKKAKADAEEKTIVDDVQSAIAAHRLDPVAEPALLHFRKTDAAGFLKAYPTLPKGLGHLTQPIATSRPAQLRVAGNGSVYLQREPAAAPVSKLPTRQEQNAEKGIDLSMVAGRNTFEKAMNHLKAQPGGAQLTLDELHYQASLLVRNIQPEPAAQAG